MPIFDRPIITDKGNSMIAKGLIGEKILFTRLAVGDGVHDGLDRKKLNALVNERKTVLISSKELINKTTARIRGILDNANVTEGFFFREMGLYALDPDEGEILYALSTIQEPGFFDAFGGNGVRTITLSFFTSVADTNSMEITLLPAAYASAIDLQELRDKLQFYPINIPIVHNLNKYPKVMVFVVLKGYGYVGYGNGGYGDEKLNNEIFCKAHYTNRNELIISVNKMPVGDPILEQVNSMDYIFRYPGYALYVSLFINQ